MALEDPISEPQKDYIRGLVDQRDITSLPEAQQEFLKDTSDGNLDRMTKGQGSLAIKALLACPYKSSQAATEPIEASPVQGSEPVAPATDVATKPEMPKVVQEGHFFIVDPIDGKEKFFRVRHGREGTRWEGFAFLDVQASDFFYSVKDRRHRELVFAEILKDPVTAMNEYGIRLGRCGVCNRVLTDRDSRLRGIGPICAQNLGPTPEQENLLRQLGLLKGE